MGKSLVIVESPAKARTINRYLGRNFTVKASMGHVRDLPKTRLGINIEDDFSPRYMVIKDKRKVIKELKELTKKVDTIYLAPDPDREGEAIAWHLVEAINAPPEKIKRITFNEITKRAVKAAFDHPGELDQNRVEAQQARRLLDRLMGYLLSPLLWEKIAKGLSAGRVQSVAVRLIVEREREIEAFNPEEYWKLIAMLKTPREEIFSAELVKVDDNKAVVPDAETAQLLEKRIREADPKVVKVEKRPRKQTAPPPFITSTMQQTAANKLRYSAKRTMRNAQNLYEGVDLGGESVGLITYMRTDSFRVSQDALNDVRTLIEEQFGKDFLPEKPNFFKARKGAQEAHEAIRPTDVTRTPESLQQYVTDEHRRGRSHSLTRDHMRLYKLIWERFVASQMAAAVFDVTTVEVDAAGCLLRASGRVLVAEGFLRVAGRDKETVLLPVIKQDEAASLEKLESTQHFTQPPNRFTEATLVSTMEKQGIGRPSTYAAILSTITDRGYAELQERKFFATDLGKLVTDQLVEHFGDLVNSEFTSSLEEKLDEIEAGKFGWNEVVRDFYKVFSVDLEKAKECMKDFRRNPEKTDEKCEKCGEHLVIRRTRRGSFQGCSAYPECKFTKPMPGEEGKGRVAEETDHKCPDCQSMLLLRSGRNGPFLGCSNYPDCSFTVAVDEEGNPAPPKETDEKCEKCGSPMIIKRGRRGPFKACSGYPKCRNTMPVKGAKFPEPKKTDFICDKCGAPMLERQGRWGAFLGCSGYPKCRNIQKLDKEGKPVKKED